MRVADFAWGVSGGVDQTARRTWLGGKLARGKVGWGKVAKVCDGQDCRNRKPDQPREIPAKPGRSGGVGWKQETGFGAVEILRRVAGK